MDIHRAVGPGLLEHAYQKILKAKLTKCGYNVESEVPVSITYDDIVIENAYRADLIVNNSLIIELKAVEKLERVHYLQLSSYMQLSNLPYGLLVNFRSRNLMEGMYSMRLCDLKNKYKLT